MKVEIWSDVVCPWCAIGKRRFEKALEGFAHRDDVEVRWRSFELDPASPREREGTLTAHLAEKYGVSVEQAEGMHAQMTETAAQDGLDFHFERARGGNTLDAHRLIHLGAEHGIQDAVKERFFQAYLTEGERIGDPETLVRLGAEAGLDEDEARAVLASDRFTADVRADERQAQAYGITGVPFYVIDEKYGVSGAQPADALRQVLDQAWAESHPVQVLTPAGGQGEACADGSCAV
ncbi:DsbA family oxidoreductase [Pseudonocardia sp.]|jgi:predicted DsbA family dithiol-disulfide isomerase|uniref:DsbA family oxidoreductase n=1 Tax=Pseudonocardia sp. TaxID=60912 RepID=UPI002635FDB2|nr:DsbA family oxidoreductase [Pseudonocardia sp.]MCW2721738.1 Disulfide bond formation protein DsbA [Pseudonocardia sp.]